MAADVRTSSRSRSGLRAVVCVLALTGLAWCAAVLLAAPAQAAERPGPRGDVLGLSSRIDAVQRADRVVRETVSAVERTERRVRTTVRPQRPAPAPRPAVAPAPDPAPDPAPGTAPDPAPAPAPAPAPGVAAEPAPVAGTSPAQERPTAPRPQRDRADLPLDERAPRALLETTLDLPTALAQDVLRGETGTTLDAVHAVTSATPLTRVLVRQLGGLLPDAGDGPAAEAGPDALDEALELDAGLDEQPPAGVGARPSAAPTRGEAAAVRPSRATDPVTAATVAPDTSVTPRAAAAGGDGSTAQDDTGSEGPQAPGSPQPAGAGGAPYDGPRHGGATGATLTSTWLPLTTDGEPSYPREQGLRPGPDPRPGTSPD